MINGQSAPPWALAIGILLLLLKQLAIYSSEDRSVTWAGYQWKRWQA